MSKDILGAYGPDAKAGRRATCGGDMTECVKPLPYKEPIGPKGQSHNSPGLGGTNHGNKVMQGKH